MVTASSFVEDSRRTLNLAKSEAERLGTDYLGSEHFLYGLTSDPNLPAYQLLLEAGSVDGVRSKLGIVYKPTGEKVTALKDVTPLARKITEVAKRRYDSDIEPRLDASIYYLLAILQLGDGISATILESEGITLERVKEIAEKYRGN